MSMTKSWYVQGRWPWMKRVEEENRRRASDPPDYPVCREITRQVRSLCNMNGLPDVCRLGPGEYAAWLREIAAQGLRPSEGYEGMPVEAVDEPGIQVIGRPPVGWE